MTERYYTTHEVSKICSVYPSTVINWIEEGTLPAFTTPGGHRRIKREDLFRLMKKNGMPIPKELEKSGRIKVLAIDDDTKISRLIKTILEAGGGDIDVITAKSGFEGGLLMKESFPDIILLDFLMPDMDGFEVTRRIRQDADMKGIPIIAVTVLRDPKEIKKMYACGVTDYLPKPFKAADLTAKVDQYIKVRR